MQPRRTVYGRMSENINAELVSKILTYKQNLTHKQLKTGQKDSLLNSSCLENKKKQKDQSNLTMNSMNQMYSSEEISKAYKFLCKQTDKNSGKITIESLKRFLQQQGEQKYYAVEMIALLDRDHKGWVSKDEFFDFFEKGIYNISVYEKNTWSSEKEKDRRLIENIDKYYGGYLRNFGDEQYCRFAAQEIKRLRYSEQL